MFVGMDLHKNYLQIAVMDDQGILLSQVSPFTMGFVEELRRLGEYRIDGYLSVISVLTVIHTSRTVPSSIFRIFASNWRPEST